jgi:alkylated DNA repair dioxygenase AlkB
MTAGQLGLFGGTPEGPQGLDYRADFLSGEEERELATAIEALPFAPFEFQNFVGKRRTVSFGWRYGFDGSGLAPAGAMPGFLLPVRERAASFAGLAAERLEHVLVTEYAPGAGIGWHRDRPVFGEVVGISLLAPARLRFRRQAGERWERLTLEAAPRSAYLLTGEARSQWEHSIPQMDALRYSVTFRTLRSK